MYIEALDLEKEDIFRKYCELLEISDPSKLVRLIKSPEFPRITVVDNGPKSKGFWTTSGYLKINKDGEEYFIELNIPKEPRDIGEIGTFLHEITHLLHLLCNPRLLEIEKEKIALVAEIDNMELSQYNALYLAIETGLPSTALKGIQDLAEKLDIPLEPLNTLISLNKFINNRHKLKPDHLTMLRITKTLMGLGLLKPDLQNYITIIEKKLIERDNLFQYYMKNKDLMKESEIQKFFETEAALRESEELKELRQILIVFFSKIYSSQAEYLLKELILEGLPELDVISGFDHELEKADFENLKNKLLDIIKNKHISSNKIQKIYYELRPGGYYASSIEIDSWLSEKDEEQKVSKILTAISNYTEKKQILRIIKILIDEELEEATMSHVITGIYLGSDLFFDFAPDSPLLDDPEYMAENRKAIIEAINSGDFDDIVLPSPQILSKSSDSVIGELVVDAYNKSMRDSSDATRERILSEIGKTQFYNQFRIHSNPRNKLETALFQLMNGLDEYCMKGHNPLDAIKYLSKSVKIENLRQLISGLGIKTNLLMEPVAYAVSRILIGNDFDFNIPAHMGYGVTFTAKDDTGNALIDRWIDDLVSFLKVDLDKRLPEILLCETIEEQRKLVGVES